MFTTNNKYDPDLEYLVDLLRIIDNHIYDLNI